MSKCVHRNENFLKELLTASDRKRESLLENATKDEIQCLTEIAFNIVNGNFPLDSKTLEKLTKHKQEVRKLSKRPGSHHKKKKFLKQKGGFLPLLLTPVLSVLGTIAGSLINSQLGL
jgi:hypothetical protein